MKLLLGPIYFHEDIYRQIELIPEENYFIAGNYISNSPVKEISSNGIYNISVRPTQHKKLEDKNISINELKLILDSYCLTYGENVTTGYGYSEIKSENTIVWGFERYGIFAKHDSNVIIALWLWNSHFFDQINVAVHLQKALYKIMHTFSLILIDWDKEIICRPTSIEILHKYLV
jgi:hypothetical protein